MATLVLTVVGSAIGGPVGGAIGAIVGQQIDQAIFRPGARQGPRLTDLAVQTSSYGSSLPKLFGTVRVAGTVIWATDLIETRTRQSGGKGRAATDVYSYSASLAVALSARPIVGIGRIWADGKLLRGSSGDLKVHTGLRVHPGDPDAALDPAIASAEGMASTPAYRGLAYVVFDALQLGEYGNRIPSLSFEVFADGAPVPLGTVIAALDPGSIAAAPGPMLGGVAAIGSTMRGLIETFATTIPMICRDDGGKATVAFDAAPATPPAANDFGAGVATVRTARLATEIAPLDTTASALTVAYFDSARDYQPGLQRARREGVGIREERADLPATLTAGAARRFAEGVLATQTAARRRAKATLPWRALALRPGDAFTLDNIDWRVAAVTLEHMVVQLDLVARGPAASGGGTVSPGRSVSETDATQGPTTLAVIDLPPLGDTASGFAQVAIFASGSSSGWRRAQLYSSIDGGTVYAPLGPTAPSAAIGVARTALPVGTTALIDRRSSVDVELIDADAVLFDADPAALLAGANLAMIGSEALQFGRAAPLGAKPLPVVRTVARTSRHRGGGGGARYRRPLRDHRSDHGRDAARRTRGRGCRRHGKRHRRQRSVADRDRGNGRSRGAPARACCPARRSRPRGRHGAALDPPQSRGLCIASGELVIATIANFRAQKDYPNLLAAARILIDRGVAARIVAVGQGPLEAEMRALHDELDLGDRVLLLGQRDDAMRVLAACDVFTLASDNEGLPVSIMEALALGLPVVATAVGGIPEAITDGVEGLLVPAEPARRAGRRVGAASRPIPSSGPTWPRRRGPAPIDSTSPPQPGASRPSTGRCWTDDRRRTV